MKISLVITELEPGGAERNLVKLAIGLARLGHDITVISLGPRPHNQMLTEKLYRVGITVFYLNCRSKWSFLRAVIKLRSTLRRLKPDLIQSFLYHANLLTSICSGHIPHFVGLRVKDPRRWRYRLLARFSSDWSGVICVSKDVQMYAAAFFGNSSTKLWTIGNGVDMNAVKSAGSKQWPEDVASSDEPLVFIGRLDPQKGLDTLLSATPKLLDDFPQRHLYIIGDGPIRHKLERTVAKLKSRERIHLTGYRDDAAAILAKAKLFLFPSRWEGMPNVVMEAMTLGIPVCSTPVDGVVELLGKSSPQIYRRDQWQTGATQMLLWDPEKLDSLGKSNHNVISSDFNEDKMVSRYLEAYEWDHRHD
ncbi:MAG: glycosyltransferase [Pirellulales bacterium]|nr:glycosyltransferase [Pirellulales bacterium]